MEKQLIKLVFITVLILSLPLDGCKKAEATKPKPSIDKTLICLDNGRMIFHIRTGFEDITNNELGQSMRNINTHILFLAIPDSDRNSMISASVYSDTAMITMEKAFEITINSVATFGNSSTNNVYKLLDYGTYKVGNKTLRYKVSTVGTGTVNLMYYFMKDDYDYDLYELKAVCQPDSYDKMREMLERIAMTVEIN